MNKIYKIREGKYKTPDEVVIDVVTTETTVVETSSVFNVGDIRKKIAVLESQIEANTKEKASLEALISETQAIAAEAVAVEEVKEKKNDE